MHICDHYACITIHACAGCWTISPASASADHPLADHRRQTTTTGSLLWNFSTLKHMGGMSILNISNDGLCHLSHDLKRTHVTSLCWGCAYGIPLVMLVNMRTPLTVQQVMGPCSHPHDCASTLSNHSLNMIINFVLINSISSTTSVLLTSAWFFIWLILKTSLVHLLHLQQIFTFNLLTFCLETLTVSPEPMLHE